MGIEAYIKPTNYEINQTKKYKSNKFRTDNMPYDEESDSITCPAGNQLINVGIKHSQSKSGFVSEQSVYRCKACCECPMKAQCTKSKTGRTIQFSKSFRKFRAQSHARITTDLGKQLRMNRSIQSEGKFGVLKQDWRIRRFLRRGKENVLTETLLYAFALNVSKLTVKNQNQKHDVILHELTVS